MISKVHDGLESKRLEVHIRKISYKDDYGVMSERNENMLLEIQYKRRVVLIRWYLDLDKQPSKACGLNVWPPSIEPLAGDRTVLRRGKLEVF